MSLTKHSDLPEELERLAKQVVDCVYTVHKELGPGFLEKIYEEALVSEFRRRGLPFASQRPMPVFYRGERLPTEYKLDMIVADSIILELKTADAILPIHEAQLLSYMKQADAAIGFVINFKQTLIKNGIRRIVMSERVNEPRRSEDAKYICS
ncbi:MAG: GxxExxY protein [Verrucomicrobiae bacterium]|nr:GxxExxY protein [Verrucomicrobiae bacterium]